MDRLIDEGSCEGGNVIENEKGKDGSILRGTMGLEVLF